MLTRRPRISSSILLSVNSSDEVTRNITPHKFGRTLLGINVGSGRLFSAFDRHATRRPRAVLCRAASVTTGRVWEGPRRRWSRAPMSGRKRRPATLQSHPSPQSLISRHQIKGSQKLDPRDTRRITAENGCLRMLQNCRCWRSREAQNLKWMIQDLLASSRPGNWSVIWAVPEKYR